MKELYRQDVIDDLILLGYDEEDITDMDTSDLECLLKSFYNRLGRY